MSMFTCALQRAYVHPDVCTVYLSVSGSRQGYEFFPLLIVMTAMIMYITSMRIILSASPKVWSHANAFDHGGVTR